MEDRITKHRIHQWKCVFNCLTYSSLVVPDGEHKIERNFLSIVVPNTDFTKSAAYSPAWPSTLTINPFYHYLHTSNYDRQRIIWKIIYHHLILVSLLITPITTLPISLTISIIRIPIIDSRKDEGLCFDDCKAHSQSFHLLLHLAWTLSDLYQKWIEDSLFPDLTS